MKIDANVKIYSSILADIIGRDSISIPVDLDYVEADNASIYEWVNNELEEMFATMVTSDDYAITNMDDLLESFS